MNINPGELNKRIKIVCFSGERDEDGFLAEQKEIVVRETWSKITRVSVSEVMKASSEINIERCRFLVRYTSVEITRDMFVCYAGKYYQILYANNYEDSNEYIEIMAEAGVK